MPEFRWPVIAVTAVLALGLFFGLNFVRQRYFQEEPFLDTLCRMEGVAGAEILRDSGGETLLITPDPAYRGALQELVASVREEAARQYKKPLNVRVDDRRSAGLDDFYRAVLPDLYEAARLGNYRSVEESITLTAESYRLEEVLFSVDFDYLYLQARDGEGYLYQMIPLVNPEGGGA